MNDFFDLASLPCLLPDRQTLQVSSFDRKSENADFGQFLYRDHDGSMVMFDDRGAGCIKSIWAAVTTADTLLSFYFGGSDVPQYQVSLQGLFLGELEELAGAGNTFEERGHWDLADCRCGNCFVPIPYTDGLKITAQGKTDGFYYHIMYEKSAQGISDFLAGGRSQHFLDAFAGKRSTPAGKTIEKVVTLTESYNHVFHADEPGVITEFTVIAPVGTDLSNYQLDISWDDDPISQVAAPLLSMFSMPFGFETVDTQAIHTRIDGDNMILSLYFPMPFWKSAGITLVDYKAAELTRANVTIEPVDITVRVTVAENTYDPANTGYFCADYRKGLTELYGDWLIGEFSGRGNIVGVFQTCHGGQYCEGNEHFYINGARTPQINGTGTEDFYLACYWPNRKFDSPVAGCINDVYEQGDSILQNSFLYHAGYYRVLHDMPISFVDGIKLAIQHGAVGQTYSDYSSVCLSYRQKDGLLNQTDYISMGSTSSMALHDYIAENSEQITQASQIEGDRKAQYIERTGLVHRNGKIRFLAAVDPENNGVMMRRLYDQTLSPQGATVYVDGVRAGDWYNPGLNESMKFADNDFWIPAALTAGKGILQIEIVVADVYSDFEYTVFSVKKA